MERCSQYLAEDLSLDHWFLKFQSLKDTMYINASDLQSKQLKRSSEERINEFIIANLFSVIISVPIVWLLDEYRKIQIKPLFKTRILIGILLASGARSE